MNNQTHSLMPRSQIEKERIKVLFQQLSAVLFGNLSVAILFTFFLYYYSNIHSSLYWLLSISIITVVRFILLNRFNKCEIEEENIIKWGWLFIITSFISGALWGITAYLFIQTDDNISMLFILMTITGLAAGAAAPLSSYARAYYAFSSPLILPYIFVLATSGEVHLIILSIMFIFYLMLGFSVAKKNEGTLDQSIILRNENKELIQQLEIKNDKTEKANSSKTRFLAAASHDLRQPLHAMSLFISLLESHPDPEVTAITKKIRSSSASLETLLESLLDISKLDAGVIDIKIQNYPVQKSFDVLKNEFTPIAHEKGLNIDFVASTLYLHSDHKNIERILRNLISNAISYTEKGRIVIGCRRKNNDIYIYVYDTGIGISHEETETVFEEFHQLDNPNRDRNKGLGLGLSIVKRLTQLLGIDISLRSTLNKGSAFCIKLPRGIKNTVKENDTTPFQLDKPLFGKTIIIVDDENEIQNALTLLLNSWGCRVLAISSVEEINEKLIPSIKPDLIIADYRLQNGTGIDAINAIYKFYQDSNIPATIITGDTAPDRIKEVKDSGFQLLHKPVSGGKLRAFLNSIFA